MRSQFLDENIMPGDPVRKTANATQVRRVHKILNDLQGIGCRVEKCTDADGRGWRIIIDGSSDIEYPPNMSFPSDPAPSDPPYFVELGDNAEGDETALTDTWTYGDVDVNSNPVGLKIWVTTRPVYLDDSDHKLYAFMRQLVYTSTGKLYHASAETKVEIENPISHSTL